MHQPGPDPADWYDVSIIGRSVMYMMIRGTMQRLAFLLSLLWLGGAAQAQEPVEAAADSLVIRLEIRGAIGPATSGYVLDGLERAAERNASLVLIEMDTPGGLDSAMREIIKAILASDIPVVTWVSPSGSRAASAGTYILYASHVAAMAPATNLGSATPVQIGGGTPAMPKPPGSNPAEDIADDKATEDEEESDAKSGEKGAAPATAMEKKVINDAVAYIRGLAKLRGRNADWAEQAVREAVSLSADEALKENVIDVLAADLPELLQAIDGRVVKVGSEERTLSTEGLVVEEFVADWRTKLLATITNPNVAYMLLLVGIYGLIFEGYNPGALVPGIVGAICLLIALFAFQILPVNYAGLGLIILGIVLMIAEAFAPSFGALGLGGLAAFVIGSIILLDSDVPGFQISRLLIGSVAALGGALLLTLMYFLVRSFRRPVVSGAEEMIGSAGHALEDFQDQGPIFVHGERWHAHSNAAIKRGDAVRVTAIRGLELEIEPAD
ncbi:MAG: NfeD family protein [Gammaproteobacteria bacterium]